MGGCLVQRFIKGDQTAADKAHREKKGVKGLSVYTSKNEWI